MKNTLLVIAVLLVGGCCTTPTKPVKELKELKEFIGK